MFYSVRQTKTRVKTIQGIGVNVPSYKKQHEVRAGTIVASIDKIEAGHVNGWVCLCEQGLASLEALVAIDDIVVASSTIKNEYKSPPTEILQICNENSDKEKNGPVEAKVLKFDISFPPVPIGVHTMRVFVDAKESAIDSWVEAYHSPAKFEESVIEPSDKAIISRKDDIITQRNNQLSKIWNEISTQLPWKKAERDADLIQLFAEKTTEHVAVILIQSEPQNQNIREAVRKSWLPSAKKSNIVARFILDNRFAGPHKAMVEQEVESSKDIILLNMEPGESMPSQRVLYGLDRAVKDYSAAFYFITLDKVLILPDRLSLLLDSLRDKGDAYIGSMKSGPVVTDSSKAWFEKDHWRFGDGKDDDPQYPRHAKGQFYGFSAPVARYIARNKEVLHAYSNEDVSVGAWMLGLRVDYINEGILNCDIESCSSDALRSRDAKCVVYSEASCSGLCDAETMLNMFKKCTQ